MREIADPRTALPDAALVLDLERPRLSVRQREPLGEDDRLRRRDEVVHTLEVSRRRRRRRLAVRLA